MLQNAYFFEKISADTAENERKFAEICQKLAAFAQAVRRLRERDGLHFGERLPDQSPVRRPSRPAPSAEKTCTDRRDAGGGAGDLGMWEGKGR